MTTASPSAFTKATKGSTWLRLALAGPAGAGKTWTGLMVATSLDQGRVAVIDTEHGSASKYADHYDFDQMQLTHYSPQDYIQAIYAAAKAGYKVVVIDSLSHLWIGEGGALDMADKASSKYRGNSFAAWKDVTPEYRKVWDVIAKAPMHLILTMRTKTAYEVQDNGGKKTPVKIGMAPQMREGSDFEVDVFCEMTVDHTLCVTKTRCHELADTIFRKPGEDFIGHIKTWIGGGDK